MAIATPGYAQVSQVIGDGTVNTLVNGNLSTACASGLCTVTGGTQVNDSLFHSFDQFSLQTGDEARFDNTGIDTIFSRVTGGGSFIDGIISTTATTPTDIFLLNPQGVLFGANATLNINGSFFTSTADSIVFDNGATFSASAPTQLGGLLSISTPIGLQYGTNPGAIDIQGPGHQLQLFPSLEFDRTNRPDGLRLNSGETLALFGGPIIFNGGNVTVAGGHVELASADSNSFIGLTKPSGNWEFDYTQASLQDIALANASSIDVSAVDGGSIGVRADALSLVDGSVMVANLLGTGTGGGITVETESLLVRDRSGDVKSGLYSDVEFLATGQGGPLDIQTQQLTVLNAGELSANTYWDGSAGNVTVNANAITMTGDSFIVSFGDFFASGNTGDVTVTANTIDLRDGAQIATTNFGAGNTGVMRVSADQLFFQGVGADGFTQSGLESFGEISNGGTILVNAETIQLVDGGFISASTVGSASGGDITVSANSLEATGGTLDGSPSGVFSTVFPDATGDGGSLFLLVDQLSLADGAGINVSTFGDGNAGNLAIRSQTIDLAGVAFNGRTAIGSNAILGTGDGGNIDIQADQVNIRDGATVTVGNFQTLGVLSPGQGAPGNITIAANGLALNNDATIVADTFSADNSLGNIVLDLDTLTLQQGSRISTNAQGSSTGGNITINAIALVARENSDISANAQQGIGGRIVVNANQILGTEFRPRLTPESDITASSDLGPSFGGTVELNTSYIEPIQGIATLPTDTVDREQQVARQCSAEVNSLVISGQGGLAKDPTQPLQGNTIWNDLRLTLSAPLSRNHTLPESILTGEMYGGDMADTEHHLQAQPRISPGSNLVEAQAVDIENGQVRLLAMSPVAANLLNPETCSVAPSTTT